VRLDGERAAATDIEISVVITDAEAWLLSVRNSVLHARPNRKSDEAAATVRVSADAFKLLMTGHTDAPSLAAAGQLAIEGDESILATLSDLLDRFPRRFPIVAPRA